MEPLQAPGPGDFADRAGGSGRRRLRPGRNVVVVLAVLPLIKHVARRGDVAAFSILILVLIFTPTGLLGRPEVEKV